jgi:hypothetical protein
VLSDTHLPDRVGKRGRLTIFFVPLRGPPGMSLIQSRAQQRNLALCRGPSPRPFTEIILMAQLIETVGSGPSRAVEGNQTARTAHGPASQVAYAKAIPTLDRRTGWTGAWGRFLSALLRALSAPAI